MYDDRVTALTRLSSEQRQKLRTEVQRIEETAGKKQAILFLILALTTSNSVSTLVDDEMLLQLLVAHLLPMDQQGTNGPM